MLGNDSLFVLELPSLAWGFGIYHPSAIYIVTYVD